MMLETEKRFLRKLIEMYGVDNAAVHYKNKTGKDALSEYLVVKNEPKKDFDLDLNM